MKKFIVFLVRKYLGLKKGEFFQFANQKSTARYYFTDDAVMKEWYGYTTRSTVSFNWLLDDECELVRGEDIKYDVYPD